MARLSRDYSNLQDEHEKVIKKLAQYSTWWVHVGLLNYSIHFDGSYNNVFTLAISVILTLLLKLHFNTHH